MAKRGRKGVIWLVSLVALVGLLVLADRGAAWAAEDAIATKVAEKAQKSKIQMSGEPEVTVEGFPFLTQVLGGEYQAIRITMRDVAMEGITLSTLDVRATGVQAALSDAMAGKGDFRAGQVTGDATVPYRAVEELVGVDGAKVGGRDGKLLIDVPYDYGAGEVTATVTAKVSVAGNVVRIKVEKASVTDGELPAYAQSALDRFAQRFSRKLPLPGLPYGLKMESASVTSAGLVARASAANVPLS